MASTAQQAAGTVTAAEIQRINEQMALLQAQLNQLELQARIAAKRTEIEGAANPASAAGAFDSSAAAPAVQSVAGLKGQVEAVLVFAGGLTQRVKAGDVIHDRHVAPGFAERGRAHGLQGRKMQRLAFGSAHVTRETSLSTASPGPLGAPAFSPAGPFPVPPR